VSGGPIITLLTDFGSADSYVAEVKGVLLGRAPGATLVDVTHQIPPGDILAAQYVLARAWHRFPEGTVHVAVVDPGVGTARRALAARARGHHFVGPDNGLFTPVLADATVVALPVPPDAAPTFHARDVFAPAAAALALGTPAERLGTRVGDPLRRGPAEPVERGAMVVGAIVYVDRFGTLVTNLPASYAGQTSDVRILEWSLGAARRTFADVPPGTAVALVGSGGALEIAVRDGSAARALGAGVGTLVKVTLTDR
jgi:S-adenosylmethionine hydrolase